MAEKRGDKETSANVVDVAERVNVPQAAVDESGDVVRGTVTARIVGTPEKAGQAKVEVRGLVDNAGEALPTLTFDPANNDGVPADGNGVVPRWSLEGLIDSLVPLAVRVEDRDDLIARFGPKRVSRAVEPSVPNEGPPSGRTPATVREG
jgi:hypothetical protein